MKTGTFFSTKEWRVLQFFAHQPFGLRVACPELDEGSKSSPRQVLRFDRLNANGRWGEASAALLARVLRLLALASLLGLSGLVWAGPGAHGPNGEHLDGPAMAVGDAGLPRVEAHTELFELVGELGAQELSLLIDRYDSNAPVLGAKVTVESGGIEAVATFHADHADYAVTDERLLALLRQGQAHALVFTITAGHDSDLLDGTLRRPVMVIPTEHATGLPWGRVLGGLALLAALAAVVYIYLQRRARARLLPGLGEPV